MSRYNPDGPVDSEHGETPGVGPELETMTNDAGTGCGAAAYNSNKWSQNGKQPDIASIIGEILAVYPIQSRNS